MMEAREDLKRKFEPDTDDNSVKKPKPEETVTESPVTPEHVQAKYLTDGRLIPAERIDDYIDALASEKSGYFKVKKIKINENKYDFFLQAKDYYAVYPMLLHSKTLGDRDLLEIKLMQNIKTNEWFVLKDYQVKNKSTKDSINNEISILANAGCLVNEMSEEDRILIVKHYVDGFDLNHYVKEEKISFSKKGEISLKMLEVLTQLHECKLPDQRYPMLCCDIKLDNFVFNSKTHQLKLIDFDTAEIIKGEEKIVSKEILVGSPRHIAPELLLGTAPYVYSEKTEIYALGHALGEWFELENNIYETSAYVANSTFAIKLEDAELAILNFLKKMVAEEPGERPALKDVHDFFKKYFVSEHGKVFTPIL